MTRSVSVSQMRTFGVFQDPCILSAGPPALTSMKLSMPNPTSEMLPTIIPTTTATKPSTVFHTTVKYSNLRPRCTAAGRSNVSIVAVPTVYASVDLNL
jgi:hypothetical protein